MSKDVKNIRLDNGKKHHEQKDNNPKQQECDKKKMEHNIKLVWTTHSINKNGTGNRLFLRTFMSNRRMFIEQEEKCKKKNKRIWQQ